MFQSYALFPNLTIYDNVAYGLVNRRQGRGAIRKRVDELLALVGLPTEGAKYPGQLSGGQQQRIALARALAPAPGLLLLDEPLSALDALERVRLRGEIRALQQRLGVTTIMVTHDQEEALSMADRIVVMNQGCIEQVGTPREIYETPATPFVADFIGKVNVLAATCRRRRAVQGRRPVRSRSRAQDVASGTAVKLYLRPEDVAVSVDRRGSRRGQLGGRQDRQGRVSRRLLHGRHRARRRRRGAARSPTCRASRSTPAASTPGAPVTVSLPPAAMRILG